MGIPRARRLGAAGARRARPAFLLCLTLACAGPSAEPDSPEPEPAAAPPPPAEEDRAARAGPPAAEPPAPIAPTRFSLPEVRARILEGANLTLAAETIRLAEARAREREAELWPNPYLRVRKRRIEDFDILDTGFLEVEVGQTFELGGKRGARTAYARAASEATGEELQALLSLTLRDAEQQFWRILRLEQDLAAAREEAEAADSLQRLAGSRFDQGKGSRTAVLRFEAAAEDARLTVQDLEQRHEGACRALDEDLGERAGTTLGVTGDFAAATLGALDQEAAHELLAGHPRLRAAARSIVAASQAIKSAEADAWPDLTLAVAYEYDYSAAEALAGFLFRLPLPFLDRNQGLREETRAALRRAHTAAEARTLELTVALESALFAYERASQNAEGYARSVIPKLEESFTLTRGAFDAGRVSYFEVLDALLALIRARRTQLDHLEEQALAAAEIRYLTGAW